MHLNGKKLLKCHLKGKASKKLANGQNIDYSEKRKRPICPCIGVKYHNIQTCLLVYAADSGERLQDHWSSGLVIVLDILFSAPVKATRVKPCIIIVLDIPFKHASSPGDHDLYFSPQSKQH